MAAQTAAFHASTALSAEVPEYDIVTMPALSPTMETGTIVEWTVQPGEEVAAGNLLCEVETDKATMGFEFQDDAVVAKYLVEPGTEITVGTPVAIIIEDADDFAAFQAADSEGLIVVDAPAAPPTTPEANERGRNPTPPPAPAAVAAAPAAPLPAEIPTSAATPVDAPAPAVLKAEPESVVVVEGAPEAPAVVSLDRVYCAPQWGTMAAKSALSNKMGQDQAAYIAKYGSTGQSPIA
jgi:pyruvate dehydrogenase E2 component (dihydrolipoamide acetyltransferase)